MGEEQQIAFEDMKCRLIKPPVLHLSNSTGRFHLYSDMSKFATGSVLYQIQNGKPKLIAYAELEMCGLAINIASFSHLVKRVDSNVIVGHLALMQIMKSKAELATTRIKRLLEFQVHTHSIHTI